MEISQHDSLLLKQVLLIIREFDVVDSNYRCRLSGPNEYEAYPKIRNIVDKLENRDCINYEFNFGITLLYLAVERDLFYTAQVLLRRGADPNIKHENNSPFHKAVMINNLKMVELLLSFGVKQDVYFIGLKAIHVCARNGNIDGLKLLIKYDGNINEVSGYGTPLWFACRYNQIKCVKFLLKRGAKINQCGPLLNLSESVKQLIDNFIGNLSLKRICTNVIIAEKFSVKNLPESFYE